MSINNLVAWLLVMMLYCQVVGKWQAVWFTSVMKMQLCGIGLCFFCGLLGMTQLTRKSPIVLRLILRGSLRPAA